MTFYKVYKIYSKNSNKYYINYTEKTVLTAILNKFILDYKTYLLNKNSLFNSVFNIIDKDDISIQLLEKFDDLNIANNFIQEYKNNNIHIISENNEIINKLQNINVIKIKRDRKDYHKKYYSKNKDEDKINNQNKQYYQNNKDNIKNKINTINNNNKIIKNTNKSKNIFDLIEQY